MTTVTLYNSRKGETKRLHQLCVFVCVAFAGIWSHQAFAQTRICGQLLFHEADHIRNPSLEQVGGYCYSTISGAPNDSANPAMSSIIPYWQIPVKEILGINYFGACNHFTLPFDPQHFIVNTNSFPIYLPLVPQPIPDGKGVLGFLSQRSSGGSASSDTF